MKRIEHWQDIDLDELRHNHVRAYWFGLGFIQLKLTHWNRLHFYTAGLGLDAINDDIHNHRYPFKSKILKGKLTASYWNIVDTDLASATHILKDVTCDPHSTPKSEPRSCKVRRIHDAEYLKGSNYWMDQDTFHQVHPGSAITLVTIDREDETYPKEVAQVVTPIGVAPICPFSVKLPDEELFRLMAKML